jgi:serine/threonine protein kinase
VPLAPGTRLGHYDIITLIGEGGMGEVYKARDSRLDRTVALKIIGSGAAADAVMRERLLREARAASSLNHPYICTVHDVHEGDQPFIAMEWIDGESLAQRLGRPGPALSVAELLHLASQVADALDAAHSSGIVHRDLKPANLFITKRGDAKILDFGLAQVTDVAAVSGRSADQTKATPRRLTNRGEAVGTVSYMAPEQARGERVDSRSDLFSLGVVLYEMATRRSAFAAQTTALTFDAILNRQPPPSRSINPDVPPGLDSIISRLLAKDPASRLQSARVLRDELQGLTQTTGRDHPSSRSSIAPSIAVLPFTNLSPEPDNEFISDGITEEIINTLAQLKGLQVAARTSSFSFKGKTPDLADVAAKLHVAHVLTGSVRKAGNRLRVTAQLINAHDAFTVWSERYDRQTDDIFQIQDEIATAIAQKLRVALGGQERDSIGKRGTDNLEAHELYLKGRFFLNQRGEGLAKGLECFERALALDPDYALVHASVGMTYALLGFYGYEPVYEAMPRARRAAQNAIALDASVAEAHSAMAYISHSYDWDWANEEREFARAVTLNERLPVAYYFHALALGSYGRFDEAVATAVRAVEIDPLSAIAHTAFALVYMEARRVEESVASAVRSVELDPHVWFGLYASVGVLGEAGRFEDALAASEHALAASQRHLYLLVQQLELHVRMGHRPEAARSYEELLDRSRTRYVPPMALSFALASMDRVEEAVEHFERAYREHDALANWNNFAMLPAACSRDPRFAAIMAHVGLTPGHCFVKRP